MSEEWLDIQSFFADRDVLTAINDLSIATKLSLAKIEDAGACSVLKGHAVRCGSS